MSEKEYLYYLSPERLDRFRYRHITEGGRVVAFSIQYEALIAGEWRPIVRYDTAHGWPHRDTLHPSGPQTKQTFPGYSAAEVLTLGERDLKASWQEYRARYEEELKV
ncbi:MAG: hypothetical protein HY784_16495 [Chloroflexi bacterium]|nr:hypothetical protein [Chloroflexota bacterium]